MKWLEDMSNCKHICAIPETGTTGSTEIAYDCAPTVMTETVRNQENTSWYRYSSHYPFSKK
jgi:hypothetical protein